MQVDAWATTEHAVPSDWSREDQEALRAWRSTAQVAQRAWLLRPTNLSTRDWVSNNYISLPATNLGDVAAGSKEKLVKEAVDVGYQHVDYSQRQALTAEYYAFLTLMKPGDLVTPQSDTTVHVGVSESEPDYAGEANDRLHRSVDWQAEVPSLNWPQPCLDCWTSRATSWTSRKAWRSSERCSTLSRLHRRRRIFDSPRSAKTSQWI